MRIGFLGCGQMANALVEGFINAGICRPEDIILSGKTRTRHLETYEKKGFRTTLDNEDVVRASDVVFLAVKPQVALNVLDGVKHVWTDAKLLISICAGIPLLQFHNILGLKTRIARVMPNTCCCVAQGTSAYVLSENAKNTQDKTTVESLLSSVGLSYAASSEEELHAVTALAGSGPAYAFIFLDAMMSGGIKCGLQASVAREMAARTLLGAAKMVLEGDKHPGVLRDNVTSPAGTTIAAVQILEEKGFRGTVMKAIEASFKRSQELGQ